MRKLTKTRYNILSLLSRKSPCMLYDEAGYNKYPAIAALEREKSIVKIFENGHYSLFEITPDGRRILQANMRLVSNGS